MILDADLTVPPEELPVFYDVIARGLGTTFRGRAWSIPCSRGDALLQSLG